MSGDIIAEDQNILGHVYRNSRQRLKRQIFLDTIRLAPETFSSWYEGLMA